MSTLTDILNRETAIDYELSNLLQQYESSRDTLLRERHGLQRLREMAANDVNITRILHAEDVICYWAQPHECANETDPHAGEKHEACDIAIHELARHISNGRRGLQAVSVRVVIGNAGVGKASVLKEPKGNTGIGLRTILHIAMRKDAFDNILTDDEVDDAIYLLEQARRGRYIQRGG